MQLVLHTTLDALAAGDDTDDADAAGSMLDTPTGRVSVRVHPATVRRLACDCSATTVITDPDGTDVLHLGRRSRRITGRLRRAVWVRDRGRCRAPGCDKPAARVHHLRHWANGGPTCLTNLVSLCEQHHWLVHEGGWTLLRNGTNEWLLLGPTGIVLDPRAEPPAAAAPLSMDPRVAADAVTGDWAGDRLDLADAITWLTHYDRVHDGRVQGTDAVGDASAEAPKPVDNQALPALGEPGFQFTAEVLERYWANIDAMKARTPTFIFDLDAMDRDART